jgi:hypothetical protein
MSKKKKKKKPIPPEVKLKRKIKKYLKRALFLVALAFIYFRLIPIFMPSYAPQVEQTRVKLAQAFNLAREQANQILGSAIEITDKLSTDGESFEGIDAEAVVDKVVLDLKSRIKALPQEQVKKVKRNFCADVIEEAVGDSESTVESGDK